MASLTREQLESEIAAIRACVGVHEMGLKLASEGILVNGFLLGLMEKELAKLPPAKIKPSKPSKTEEKPRPVGVG